MLKYETLRQMSDKKLWISGKEFLSKGRWPLGPTLFLLMDTHINVEPIM